jgi:hypothetical protein
VKYSSIYYVQGKDRLFFVGDEVSIKTIDGGGRTGEISHITSKGLYLNVGNKRDTHFNFEKISEITLLKD